MPDRREMILADDPAHLVQFLVEKWLRIARACIKERGCFTCALSGGTSFLEFYNELRLVDDRELWAKTHLFLVDERFVSFADSESNFRFIYQNLISQIKIGAYQVHAITTHRLDLETAARHYEDHLRNFFKLSGKRFPCFDAILLGIGEDGHTASLFPGAFDLGEKKRWVVAVKVKRVRQERISLSLPVLNAAAHIIFCVQGKRKADILKDIMETSSSLPAALVQPRKGKVYFFVDQQAAQKLSRR